MDREQGESLLGSEDSAYEKKRYFEEGESRGSDQHDEGCKIERLKGQL